MLATIMKHLDESIERLYRAFADVPKPQEIDGCPCCWTKEETDELMTFPLRQVPSKLLGIYAASALLTVGSAEDYLFYLPRILEVSAKEFDWWPDPEVSARAIASTDVSSWSNERRDALEEFLKAVILDCLNAEKGWRLDSWMCAIARMKLDVRKYLKLIEVSFDAVLAYFDNNSSDLPSGRLSNSFWELPDSSHDQIVSWFYSKPVREIATSEYGFVWPEKIPNSESS